MSAVGTLILASGGILSLDFIQRRYQKYLETKKELEANLAQKARFECGLISKEDLHDRLDSTEFEHWCAQFLGDLGYENIQVTPQKIDGGKDIICEKNGEKVYVECKQYLFQENAKDRVTKDMVQKLVGAMTADEVYKGMILTSGVVTERAREYVSSLPWCYAIDLIDGNDLIKKYWQVKGLVQNKNPS